MKQVLQSLKDGTTQLIEVPAPRAARGQLLIRTTNTLVSAGTERMLVEFGKANMFNKARQQPDKVRMVLDKVRTDGLAATLDAVQSKLDQPLALGYCNVGVVAMAGSDTDGFAVGQRVVSNGKHAEMVCVAKNLCAHIPEQVSDEQAAFTVLAAIGLQGIRLVNPTLGECVVVTGLGLIGLLTVQMLRAQGCRVLGIDFDPQRLALARQFGADVVNPGAGEDVLALAQAFSRGRGVDAVIITASTKSSEPVSQAAQMCRKRGRIVLVGVTGLELSRADFYEKELSFQVSCSYGPGRYDPGYEEKGQDYPVGYVRWTEQRNFEAVLDLFAAGKLDVAPLISHRFPIDQAEAAYSLLASNEPSLGILLDYPAADVQTDEVLTRRSVRLVASPQLPTSPEGGRSCAETADTRLTVPAPATGQATVSFIGAGNYAGRTLIPAFKKAGATLHTVATSSGVSAVHYGKKYGFREATTDTGTLLADSSVNTVVIATQHNTHAHFVCDALKAGKHVFVEKPLALTLDELEAIAGTYRSVHAEIPFDSSCSKEKAQHLAPLLMIGFNRRFAPQVQKIKALLAEVNEPKSFILTVNAGAIPSEHWTQDPTVGGGRIIGEGCHFVDLLRFLAGSPIIDFDATFIGAAPGIAVRGDKVSFSLRFADGSIGTVHYLANGHKSFPKERLDVFCAGRVLQLDNFRKLKGFGWPGFRHMNLWRQNKGQDACAASFVECIRNNRPAPIPFAELIEVSRVSIELAQAEA
ncbi:MAG: bi-domain-containing oxidoreductase [Candidatus Competibacteraceae bacterium]|nr:bi-domain-containing oxidoreductase [Candidatus Competibacteraceae bacterium]